MEAGVEKSQWTVAELVERGGRVIRLERPRHSTVGAEDRLTGVAHGNKEGIANSFGPLPVY